MVTCSSTGRNLSAMPTSGTARLPATSPGGARGSLLTWHFRCCFPGSGLSRVSSADLLTYGQDRPDESISTYLAALTLEGRLIPPSTARMFVEPQARAHAGDGASTGALEVIRAESRLLLLGDAGSGKSTAIRVLTHRLALEYLRSASRACPVLVQASALPSPGSDPWMWLAMTAAGFVGCDHSVASSLAAALEAGRAHLLVDGLDEVADPSQRSRIALMLKTLEGRSPSLRICVSSRPAGAGADGLANRFAVWSLLPLDDAQAWGLLSLLTGSRKNVERQLAMAPWLGAVARGNPLFLHLLSLYTSERGFSIPHSRVRCPTVSGQGIQ